MAIDGYTGLALPIVVLALLWPLASALLAVAYRPIKPWMPTLPKQRSAVLLFLCMAPALISLALTASVFSSWSQSRLVEVHCHPGLECATHVPAVAGGLVTWVFMGIACLLAGSALLHLVCEAARMRRLALGLDVLAGSAHCKVRLIPSAELLAFSVGLLRPTIFVSQGLVQQTSSRELEAILQHERAHGQRRDNLRNWVAVLCTSACLPRIRKDLLQEFRVAAEQCCDAVAARAMADPLLVAHTLVKVQKLARRPRDIGMCEFIGSSIEARVGALLQPSKRHESGLPLAMLLPVLLACSIGLVLLATEPLHHVVEALLDGLRLLSF